MVTEEQKREFYLHKHGYTNEPVLKKPGTKKTRSNPNGDLVIVYFGGTETILEHDKPYALLQTLKKEWAKKIPGVKLSQLVIRKKKF